MVLELVSSIQGILSQVTQKLMICRSRGSCHVLYKWLMCRECSVTVKEFIKAFVCFL